MPPKKKESSSTAAASSAAASHEFSVGDTVLAKIKGYPDWPAKIMDNDVATKEVMKHKGNKSLLVRFFPDGDFNWYHAKELKPLTPKSITAYLSDGSGRKSGKLRTAYTVAQDPTEWEENLSKNGVAGGMDEDDEVEDIDAEDVDMLAEDGEDGKKGKKAAAAKSKKAPASKTKKAADKKEPASKGKKRKTADDDDEAETASKPAKKTKAEPAAKKGKASAADKKKASEEDKKAAASGSAVTADDSEGAKTVKGWRATLQKAFLSKGIPSADKMPEFDTIFTEMEKFEMQTEWLTASKLGKVLKKLSTIPAEIPREAEFKLKERSSALIEKWKEMLVREGEDTDKVDPPIAAAGVSLTEQAGDEAAEAGDLTAMDVDAAPVADDAAADAEKKDEAVPAAEEDKKESNGDVAAPAAAEAEKDGVNAEGQTNGEPETA